MDAAWQRGKKQRVWKSIRKSNKQLQQNFITSIVCYTVVLEINKLQPWKSRALSSQTVRWLNKRKQKSHAYVIFAFFCSFVFFCLQLGADWEAISKTRASCFIGVSKHWKTIKNGLGLSSVFSCLETSVNHLHSFLNYYFKLRPQQSALGVKLKFSDEHRLPFHMGVPPRFPNV